MSEILNTGPVSVAQGSVLSGLLYNLFSLDMNNMTHEKIHETDLEYNKCQSPNNTIYVDDCYGIVVGNDENIWREIQKYILKMNHYYNSNKIIMNVKKCK